VENILITGAHGFVGAALLRHFDRNGAVRTIAMSRDRTRQPFGITSTHIGNAVVYGDVTDYDFCRRVIADYNVTQIYHLAAQSIVSVCAEDPVTAINIAAVGTAKLLQAVRESGRPIRVVVSTSDKVYGHSPSPYTEDTKLDARYAYEVSKACQDLIARMFFHNFRCDVRIARAVNIYGPGDLNESRVIPQTIRRALRGEMPLLHAGAGSMRRQYIYIDDLVEALCFIADHGSPGEIYNVGSLDAPMTVLDVIQEISRQVGTSSAALEVRDRESRFVEIQEQAACDDKLRALGWEPRTVFRNGIKQTIDWYREFWR
jgi:CDP-glucose 4,6-dehydratase